MKTELPYVKAKNTANVIRRYANWINIGTHVLKRKNISTVILRNGIRIDAPENNILLSTVDEIFFMNVYNPTYLPIGADDVVVDIGANVGVFTLFAAGKTQNTIYAYEPSPINFKFLNRNIRTNRLPNVITYDSAVCDKSGSAELFFSEIDAGHMLFNHNSSDEVGKHIKVPAITLQRIMEDNNLKQIDFLKMDCEGSEGSILSSTPTEYLKQIKKIAIEFHDNVSELKHEDIQRLFEKIEFTTKLEWDGKSPFGYIYAKRN